VQQSFARFVMGTVTETNIHNAIQWVWRIESARIVAGIARIVRDIGVAEDLAQDALVAALEQWPTVGVDRRATFTSVKRTGEAGFFYISQKNRGSRILRNKPYEFNR